MEDHIQRVKDHLYVENVNLTLGGDVHSVLVSEEERLNRNIIQVAGSCIRDRLTAGIESR